MSRASNATIRDRGHMEPTIRGITPDDFPAFDRAIATAFGETVRGADEVAADRTSTRYDRCFAAFDGPRVVGTIVGLPFDLVLPGLATLPVGAITGVGVLPTHRRRGLLRSLMGRELDRIADGGEAVAILTASESGIYGRFGFAPATVAADLEIDTRHAAFAIPLPTDGTLTLIDHAEAKATLPPLYDRVRRRQPGALSRDAAYWAQVFRRWEKPHDGASPMFIVAHATRAGQADGMACYRIKEQWEGGLPRGSVLLRELITATDAAATALWRFCVEIDLTTTLHLQNRPLEEPLRWRLADPRQLRVTRVTDDLWVRLLDVPRALAARRYATEDRFVLAVEDPSRPANTGRYLLAGGPGGAACHPTEDAADLTLDVATLGALYLGGTRLGTLARAGRIGAGAADTLRRADLFFGTDPAPWCGTPF